MKNKSFITAIFIAFVVPGILCIPSAHAILGILEDDRPKEEKQAEVRAMAQDTLAKLYSASPSAKRAVVDAAGYAVFSNFGLKLGVIGSGSGKGMAVNNKTGQETFMKMLEVQGGLGLGGKTFYQIFVFATERAFNNFINMGWTLGSQATAAAKAEETGIGLQEAVAVAPGVYLYQLTETGLAAELTAKGTKYYKNDDLN